MASIMLCVDFSRQTKKTVEAAIDLARAFELPIHVVHVRTGTTGTKHVVTSEAYQTLQAKQVADEQQAFATVVSAVEASGLTVTSHMSRGNTVDVIVGQARKVDARYIVMGSHGTGAMYHLVVGSVAGGVLKELDTPVLLVPGPREA
ncbi:MAG: universal stress protein [Spirochaetaceae bacterium]